MTDNPTAATPSRRGEHVHERVTRRVGAEVAHVPSLEPQQVGRASRPRSACRSPEPASRARSCRVVGRAARLANRADRRGAWRYPIARCSSAMSISPACPALTDRTQRRGEHVGVDLADARAPGHGRLDHTPRTVRVAGEQPRLEPIAPGGACARAGAARRPRHRLGTRRARRCAHSPPPADLRRLELAEAHVPVRGHVVHAQLVGCLLERELVDRHAENGTAHPPACLTETQKPAHQLGNDRDPTWLTRRERRVQSAAWPSSARGRHGCARAGAAAPLGGLRQLDTAARRCWRRVRSPPRRAAGRRTTAARRPASSTGTSRGRCRRGPTES